MSIHIKSIQIHKAGPLDSLSFELGKLNLFYGYNETGKTYLVEFILRSLFKRRTTWSLRESTAEGSLVMEGITDQPISFSPASSKKLEDYLINSEEGLPGNLSRLLIVKGGELDFTKNVPGGVDRDVLKTALTNQEMIDDIWQKIPITVRKASLINQEIIGNNQGKIKERNQGKKDLEQINKLISSVEELYSKGPAKQLEKKIFSIEKSLQEQLDAKRYYAYQLSNSITDLIREKENLSDILLNNLRDLVRDHRNKEKEIEILTDQIRKSKKESEDYLWIKAALEIWDDNQLDVKEKPHAVSGYLGLALIGIGLIALYLNQTIWYPTAFWPGITMMVIGSGLMTSNLIRILRWSSFREESEEKTNLQKGFKDRFGFLPTNLADIKKQKDNLHETFLIRNNKQTQLDQQHLDLRGKKLEIESLFFKILNEEIVEGKWDATYLELTTKSTRIQTQIHQYDVELNKLNIPEQDYRENPTRDPFDSDLEKEFEKKLTELTSELNIYYQELDTIKNRVCERIGLDIDTHWADVYHGLLSLRDEHVASQKTLTAELVAMIGLTEILYRIQSEEDQKINKEINSSNVSEIMRTITGKYHKLDLSEDRIFVEDQYRRFALGDLSTGAIEQIQLSLRLGIASQIAGDNPLFLILDDAFQHSDWERRISLVNSAVNLVKNGWQVTYLSMDDHIRDLFLKAGKAKFGEKFTYFEL